jgi:methionyl-tRNA formyltransferase
MSIIFVATPAFAVPSLERLVADGHQISAVVTRPDRPAGRRRNLQASPVKLAAGRLAIPVLQPESLRDPGAIAELQALAPTSIVVVAYGQILRRQVLDIPERGVLNVHPSLLPRWRGASPIPASILAGDNETGVTIMLMDEGMDSGPILSQKTLAIDDEDTTASLTETLANEGAALLSETLPRWLAGEIARVPQDSTQATVCPLIRKEDGAIDWTLPATEIWRRIRAYNPWPGAYTYLNDDLFHIWRAWPHGAGRDVEPGTVLLLDNETREALPPQASPSAAIAIQTGDGLLVPIQLQRAGRRPMPAADFQRGMPDIVGKRLSSPE